MSTLGRAAMCKRAVVVATGRGSYNSTELGTLGRMPFKATWEHLIASADQRCTAAGLSSISELDAAERFQRAVHLEAAHASSLIYTLTVANMRALSRAAPNWEPVGLVGNSLGWYSATHIAGCVSFEQGLDLVLSTGGYQRSAGSVGGQLVYPTLDENWQRSEVLSAAVERGLAEANARGGFASTSIDLGGLMVLAADDSGLATLKAELPPLVRGNTKFPLELPGHSAFHTSLMAPMAQAVAADAAPFASPEALPLVDGAGRIWRVGDDAEALREYTLGDQILTTYDFARSLEVALQEWAPDAVVLLGPGASLAGATGQVMARMGWRGIRSKQDFARVQASASPLLITPGSLQ